MKKIFIFLTVCAALLNAQMLQEGSSVDEFSNYEFKTPHDKKVDVPSSTKLILVSFEKDASAVVNEYLSQKEELFLNNHDSVFIADINKMPSIITKMFALPKLRKYKHTIHLHYDEEFQNNVPHREDQITVIRINEKTVKSISYITTREELEKLF